MPNPLSAEEKAYRQEKLYTFPYHYLPHADEGVWRLARSLDWGYEYLGLLQVITNLVLKDKPQSVLDFGCGDGRLLHELGCAGINHLVGVDISRRALLFAEALSTQAGCQLYNRVSELPERSFDTIVAMEVLEHLPPEERGEILFSLARSLKPGGRFIISVPTTNLPLNPKHFLHFDEDTLKDVLKDTFSVEDCSYVHRIGWRAATIRRLCVNRFFLLTFQPLLHYLTRQYQRYVMLASKEDGAHLVAICKPRVS